MYNINIEYEYNIEYCYGMRSGNWKLPYTDSLTYRQSMKRENLKILFMLVKILWS